MKRYHKASGVGKMGLQGFKFAKQHFSNPLNLVPVAGVANLLLEKSNIELIPFDELKKGYIINKGL